MLCFQIKHTLLCCHTETQPIEEAKSGGGSHFIIHVQTAEEHKCDSKSKNIVSLPSSRKCRRVETHRREEGFASREATLMLALSLEELASTGSEPISLQLVSITPQPVTAATRPCCSQLLSLLGPFYFQSSPKVPKLISALPSSALPFEDQ